MSGGGEFQHTPPATPTAPQHSLLAKLIAVQDWLNRLVLRLSMIAIVAAAGVLTYSSFGRYFLKTASDWQDEVAVFLLVGATFLCGASVQAQRGHVGIEALTGYLSPRLNRLRLWLVDLVSFLFCTFFAWKSWSLFHEALAEGQTTSSTWAPPLAIPYGLMAFGMSMLALQLLTQTLLHAYTPAKLDIAASHTHHGETA